jgi:hypothetical protein
MSRIMRGSYSGNTLAFQANAESSILLPRSTQIAWLTQLVEFLPYTQAVGGSSPSPGTKHSHSND